MGTIYKPIPVDLELSSLAWTKPLSAFSSVAGTRRVPGLNPQAAIWTPTLGTVELSPALAALGAFASEGYAISALGAVVGQCSSGLFRWTPAVAGGVIGKAKLIPSISSGVGVPVAMNRAGWSVGYVSKGAGSAWALWPVPDGVLVLSGFGSPPGAPVACAINDLGQVAGRRRISLAPGANGLAHLWQPKPGNPGKGTFHKLDTFPGETFSIATDINLRGQICGGVFTPLGGSRSFLWTPTAPNGTTGSAIDLGLLPGTTTCNAAALNRNGHVVGACYPPVVYGPRAFLHTGSMMDLNYHVLPGSVGTLEVAHDINDAGHILCSARSGPRVDPVLLVPTRWKLRDIAFLQGVSWILGGEDDGPGWVIVPGRGPRPVPPWVRELWRSLSPSARARVTAIASRDPVRLLDEPALHRELQRIVPRLSEVEEGP